MPEPATTTEAPPSSTAAYRWALVWMLWFICFFNYADRLAIFSVFPLLEKQYHLTKTQLGWIGAAFTWVYALASPFAGHIGDRYPRKWVILGGLWVWSLITGLTAQCRLVWQFLLVRGAEGLGEAFYFPASMAIISDYHTPATRSRAIGLHQTSIFAGTIGGSALAGWMGQRYGWQSPFWCLAVAGISLGVLLRVFIREPIRNQAEREERGAILEPARTGTNLHADVSGRVGLYSHSHSAGCGVFWREHGGAGLPDLDAHVPQRKVRAELWRLRGWARRSLFRWRVLPGRCSAASWQTGGQYGGLTGVYAYRRLRLCSERRSSSCAAIPKAPVY